ncbi:f-box domain-containing protein [Fusarium mundagurra]|uniref:F-box domain-containing protein n=1 Tax=Fusarium mundagurra TaxID=1567541 RepID=A0A8H5XYI9_9HYPO|nr:f-box domain-containing protein [Fusarium mundagurra]
MSNVSSELEALIPCASHGPRHLLEAMITIPDAQKPTRPTLAERVSSLGILDRLPPEIIYMILGMLDMQSIASFARVSFRGNTYIKLLQAYRDLVAFAPQILMALGKVGLLSLHSITELHAALRKERCASCVEYGAFLFLPTCERCCWECLRHNPLLRVLLPKEAKRYFGLSERHIQQLPTISVIPGNYGISRSPSPRYCSLVSVRAAKERGLMVHGSVDQLSQAMMAKCKSGGLRVDGRFLQSDPVTSRNQDPLLLPSQGNIPTDKFFGMASIPFPSLSASGRLENGLWCRGCELTLHQYDNLRLPWRVLAALVPGNRDALRVLLGLERRARSTESFLEHIKHCYGIQQLVPQLTIGDD